MNRYQVLMVPEVYRELDNIYMAIVSKYEDRDSANHLINELEALIQSLEIFPYRGAKRKTGAYAKGDYRQLIYRNYIIVYRILEKDHKVLGCCIIDTWLKTRRI